MIRRGVAEDIAWSGEVAGVVYGDLGAYGTLIPAWLEHPGLLFYIDICERTGIRRGFALLGFYQLSEQLTCVSQSGPYAADLLALAVAPRFQRQGIGRALLDYTIGVVEVAASGNRVREMRLSVAEGNAAGMKLYRSTGFQVLDPCHGTYDGGQRAIRMARPVVPARARRTWEKRRKNERSRITLRRP